MLSGFAPNLTALYLFYGVLGGIGLGLGYIVPLAVLIKWFPDKRGFITGLAVTGFGLGALVTSPLATELIKAYGVQSTLTLLGAAYLAIVVMAAQFLRSAPDNYAPPGWTPAAQADVEVRSGGDTGRGVAHAALVSSVVDAGAQRHRRRSLDLRRRAAGAGTHAGRSRPWARSRCA